MIYKELLVVVFVALNIYSIQALSPSERCEIKGGTGRVCSDCLTAVDCEFLSIPIACDAPTVCDSNLADGYCITVTSVESPICMCATDGTCLVDPNSEDVLLDCVNGPDVRPSETTRPSCDPATPIFDPTVCDCVEIEDCPPCGSITLDTDSDCIKDYFYCGGSITVAVECESNQCYNSTTCKCLDPGCGECGYKEVEGDSTKYIYCEDGKNEELPCPFGTSYNPDSCVCVSEEACPSPPPTESPLSCPPTTDCPLSCPPTTDCPLSCPPTTDCPLSCPPTTDCPTTDPTSVCLACGLEAGSASCSEYYSCDNNGRTGGPYNCPGTLCFDAATCNCV